MEVVIGEEALEQIEAVPFGVVDRVWEVIRRLENWPNVSGAKPLRGKLKGSFRIRTGDYRILFRVQGQRIAVWRIRNRSDVYED